MMTYLMLKLKLRPSCSEAENHATIPELTEKEKHF